jgi:hypothetical protein
VSLPTLPTLSLRRGKELFAPPQHLYTPIVSMAKLSGV